MFILYLYGCSSIEVVQLDENNFDDFKDSDIVSVAAIDNKIYEFETSGIKPKPEIKDSALIGWAKEMGFNKEYKINEFQIRIDNI